MILAMPDGECEMKKPYAVVFTGELASNVDFGTVKSNLVLSVGMSDEKAEKLLARGEVLLKHFATSSEAENLAELFHQAGAICEVRDTRANSKKQVAALDGESSLVRILKHFTGSKEKKKA
jgi:hypothetical protein